MDKYVVDLETAKKLKNYLPHNWHSYDFWYFHNGEPKIARGDIALRCLVVEVYDAPILEEMLELLPNEIESEGNTYYLNLDLMQYIRKEGVFKSPVVWSVPLDKEEDKFSGDRRRKKLTATAAAKLYMWLVDEGYIKDKP